MNLIKPNVGDIFQFHFNQRSYVKVLEVLEFSYKVQYIKSRHGVPIRKGRIFVVHENWLRKYKFNFENRRFEYCGWLENKNNEI